MPPLTDVVDTQAAAEDFSAMSAKELKAACKGRGLRVTGTKRVLVERLENPGAPLAKRAKTGRMSVEQVHAALASLGYDNPWGASACVKKAIQKGHLSLDGGLEATAFSTKCEGCRGTVSCTVKELLGQADNPGLDYEDGGFEAAIQCEDDECPGTYVTGFCEGEPKADSGKSHNHCTECPGFGKCLGDYREAHCSGCNKHYFAGCTGFGCPRCGGGW